MIFTLKTCLVIKQHIYITKNTSKAMSNVYINIIHSLINNRKYVRNSSVLEEVTNSQVRVIWQK